MSDKRECPFCGEVTRISKQGIAPNMQHGAYRWLHCDNCGAYGKWTDRDPIAAWNTRPTEDALRAIIESQWAEIVALREQVAELEETDDCKFDPFYEESWESDDGW